MGGLCILGLRVLADAFLADGYLPGIPAVAVPVAAAFMLADRDRRTPFPGVGMDHDMRGVRIAIALMAMPAHVARAGDCRRGAHRRDRHKGGARGRANKELAVCLHFVHLRFPPETGMRTAGTGVRF